MTQILKIDYHNPEPELIARAGRIITGAGVIAYPTETVYGIGCSAFITEAVNRVYSLKNRDQSKAMILIAADPIQISEMVETIPEAAEILMDEFWPGPLTLVFEVSPRLGEFAFRRSKTIAIRIPDCAICLALLKNCGFPIVSTSANKSGQPEATTAEQVIETFGDSVDAILDGGETPSKSPSTVVDITRTPPRILREGAISALEINTVLKIL